MKTPEAEDLVAGAGGVIAGAGVWVAFSLGWAVMAVGAVLLAAVVVGALRSWPDAPGRKP